MDKPENTIQAICRPARQEDTPDVLELTRTIWEGEDYVPEVWDAWLKDPLGALLVAEYQGRVIGLGKLSQQSKVDWWMHGLRVHPEYEGHKVASQLHRALVKTWEEIGDGAVRLATASFRKPVQHLCDRTGFIKVDEFSPFVADTIRNSERSLPEIFRAVRPEELQQAYDFAMQAETLAFNGRQVDLGWEWLPVNPEIIERAIGAKGIWQWREWEGLAAFIEDEDPQDKAEMRLSFAATKMELLSDLLFDIRKLAGVLEREKAGWMASLRPGIVSALEKAGFRRDWEASIYLYEKKRGVGS